MPPTRMPLIRADYPAGTLAIARCFAVPEVTAILLDPLASNTRSHRFYERLGFRFVEPRQFGADHCHVYRLDRTDWQPSA